MGKGVLVEDLFWADQEMVERGIRANGLERSLSPENGYVDNSFVGRLSRKRRPHPWAAWELEGNEVVFGVDVENDNSFSCNKFHENMHAVLWKKKKKTICRG